LLDANPNWTDALLEGAIGVPPGPEARYEQTEAISPDFCCTIPR